METQTNEEKALELSSMNKHGFTVAESNAAYDAALEAMKWKDEQWKKRLQYMFIGGWTASLDIDNCSPKCTTTISFVKEDYGI